MMEELVKGTNEVSMEERQTNDTALTAKNLIRMDPCQWSLMLSKERKERLGARNSTGARKQLLAMAVANRAT